MKLSTFTVFDELGQSRWVATNSDIVVTQEALEAGWNAVDGSHDETKVLVDGVVTQKEQLPAVINKTTVDADGVDAVIITGLPTDTFVKIQGALLETFDNPDTDLELTFDYVGQYEVTLDHPNYLPLQINIEAV